MLSTGSFAASSVASTVIPVEAYGMDTIAGSPVVLRTSKIQAGLPVTFVVTQPNNQQIQIEGVSDSSGVAYAKLSDYYTKAAGAYSVAVAVNSSYQNRANSFTILPEKLSMINSELLPRDQVIHVGSEVANLTVKLKDDFSNSISGHIVKLISSAENDNVVYQNGSNVSDKNGEVHFRVNPGVSGLVSYSLYDLTADQVLNSRSKIVYFDSSNQVFNKQGSVKLAAYPTRHGALASAAFSGSNEGNAAGPVDHFEVQDVPAVITSEQSVTLKITAYDSSGQPVSNYAGTVRFSVDGANSGFATLPNDYTYSIQDQGSHVFSLAFNFKQPGVYNLKITDLSNVAILGTKSITVTAATGSNSSSGQSGITLTNPAAGAYSSNLQVVTGTAPVGVKLKIFDNNAEIASIVADASGKFSYTTGLLADGAHKLYVASVNDIGTVITTSATVDFTISTKAAKISQIVVDPSGVVDPGTMVSAKVYSDDILSKAQLVVAGNVYDLTKNPAGYYEASFKAPIDFGQYKLAFDFVSELGNESKSEDKVLQVGKVGPGGAGAKPAIVTGLIVQPADGKVILNWSAPTSLANQIKNYRIYFGNSPNQLSNAADTFTNATTWYIPNLQNGTQYYFTVAAVDMKGNVSDGFDKILPAMPSGAVNKVQPPDVQNGSAGKDQVKYMNGDTSKTGPEISWLFLLSVLGGFFYTFIRKRKSE